MGYQARIGHRKAWHEGGLFGIMLLSGNAEMLELSKWAGADYVIIDTENADGIDIADTLNLIRAADGCGLPAIVRVTEIDQIKTVLDYGAAGIAFPGANSVEEAEAIVAAAKYPPVGRRGSCPRIRAVQHDHANWDAYVEVANRETVVVLFLETAEACENADAIASVPGVDVLGTGRSDLSQSLGVHASYDGAPSSEKLDAYIEMVFRAAERNGIGSLMPVRTQLPQGDIEMLRGMGCTNFLWSEVSVYYESLQGILASARGAFTPALAEDR